MKVGLSLGLLLKKGDFLALSGELGAGKTTMVKGIVSAFKSSEYVKSPSFTIVNEYQLKDDLKLFHLDFYRVDAAALDDIGWTEMLDEGIVVVEWSEKIIPYIPHEALLVKLKYVDELKRDIIFYGDEIWTKRLTELKIHE
jgi:tRNA threonylcarbamoyladenosine biosynthesis protein TsaE